MKTILATMRDDRLDIHGQKLEVIEADWVQFASTCGFRLLSIPNDKNSIQNLLQAVNPAGVLLTGGGNIGEISEANTARDLVEESLLEQAEALNVPVIGVCRGMHRIAAHSNTLPTPTPGHTDARHAIKSQTLRRSVNSFHDYALLDCPDGFSVEWRSDDGAIEAIRSVCGRLYACMWHPERESFPQSADISTFRTHFKI